LRGESSFGTSGLIPTFRIVYFSKTGDFDDGISWQKGDPITIGFEGLFFFKIQAGQECWFFVKLIVNEYRKENGV
jgi:hypothetical protein